MKFRVRGSGSGGIGHLGKMWFPTPVACYETDDPEEIKLLSNCALADVIEETEDAPVEAEDGVDEAVEAIDPATESLASKINRLESMKQQELRDLCSELNAPPGTAGRRNDVTRANIRKLYQKTYGSGHNGDE